MREQSRRRKILKSIVAGTGAIMAGNSWGKPDIYPVVILNLMETPCSTSLPFGPYTVDCSGAGTDQSFLISIDDSGECPVLAISPTQFNVIPNNGLWVTIDTSESDFYRIAIYLDGVASDVSAEVITFTDETCTAAVTPYQIGFPLVANLTGVAGTYQATLSITVAQDKQSITLNSSTFDLI